jgi:hypothetical protein
LKDSNDKEIKKLIHEKPETWPEEWKIISNSVEKEISPKSERKIIMMIKEAEREKRKNNSFEKSSFFQVFNLRWTLVLAGISFLLATVYYFDAKLSSLRSPISIETEGKVIIKRENFYRNVPRGTIFFPGDELSLSDGSFLVFALPISDRIRILFRLNGPGKVKFTRIGLDSPDIEIAIEEGSISIYSGESERMIPKKVVWKTKNATYTLNGTIARLKTNGETEILEVLEGYFQLSNSFSEKAIEIKAGQEAFVNILSINIEPLKSETKEILAELSHYFKELHKENLPSPRYKIFPDKEIKVFNSEKELKEHYGSIQEIRLRDGSIIKGHLTIESEEIMVQTLTGVRQIEKSEIDSVIEK